MGASVGGFMLRASLPHGIEDLAPCPRCLADDGSGLVSSAVSNDLDFAPCSKGHPARRAFYPSRPWLPTPPSWRLGGQLWWLVWSVLTSTRQAEHGVPAVSSKSIR